MKNHSPEKIYLKDYQPPQYCVSDVNLKFEVEESHTAVTSELMLVKNSVCQLTEHCVLEGEGLTLKDIKINDEPVAEEGYHYDGAKLSVLNAPSQFKLTTTVWIYPHKNTSLEGLYQSSSMLCTQCEAHGFRKITFFPDRPDVMALFKTTIVADKGQYPYLLSNGDCIETGDVDGNRHFATWTDPHKKPCYLFALVAGNLTEISDSYTTSSQRKVAIRFFVEHQNADKCVHAIDSLKRSMKWDEEQFGREYDLDTYMVVAVDDFNMGAMENKGLNIFNSKYVLAKQDTATDKDYQDIEAVIGHEYFHNWTGNRITCRDWFQLSLKEGLTVFREQEFSADMGSRAVKRIEEVDILRRAQFAEDAGAMAHPVKPSAYIEMNNFYTATVYNKGAELIRMMHLMMGEKAFRQGMDLYFKRHDGQAVTTEDYVSCLEEASGRDFTQFKHWYTQSGTPVIKVECKRDESNSHHVLTFEQHTPKTADQETKVPLHIPIKMALFDDEGNKLTGSEEVVELTDKTTEHKLTTDQAQVIPSLVRGFSAPVKLEYPYTEDQLLVLFQHDDDPFARWEAGQKLYISAIQSLTKAFQQGQSIVLPEKLLVCLKAILTDESLDAAFAAKLLMIPTEAYLLEQSRHADVDATHQAREALCQAIYESCEAEFHAAYHRHKALPFAPNDPVVIGKRALKNQCLRFFQYDTSLMSQKVVHQHFASANTMTDKECALFVLAHFDNDDSRAVFTQFANEYADEPLVMDKWLSAQASSSLPNCFDNVKTLMNHSAFELSNPNRVRALVGCFAMNNPYRFHQADGSVYHWYAGLMRQLDTLNPQVTARMLKVFSLWRSFDENRQAHIKASLDEIIRAKGLSKDAYEVVSLLLAG